MPRRIRIEDIEKLEKEYMQGEKSSDFKALIIKLVEKLGSVSEVSNLTDIPERTISKVLHDLTETL